VIGLNEEHMSTRNDRILDWAIKKIQLEYSNDICLLVAYGSYINGTEDSLSDVDFYFVPGNDNAYRLGRTFIIEGIGYDLFPMPWERLEALARLDESLTPLLGKAEIVYSGSDEHKKRFEKLKGILDRNLSDSVFMHQKAVDKFVQATLAWCKLVEQSELCDCRLLSGDILLNLADAVAYANMTYFKNGLKRQFTDLKTMDKLPVDFTQEYEAIIRANTPVQLREGCGKLIESCRGFLNCDTKTAVDLVRTKKPLKEVRDINYHVLAELYGEIISTFNKVYKYCENGKHILAFISALSLQHTLNEDTQGLKFEVLGDYDAADLSRLSASAKAAENNLVKYISRGARIKRYTSVDEFLREYQ
jgi:predicted nucleotidyltransferase